MTPHIKGKVDNLVWVFWCITVLVAFYVIFFTGGNSVAEQRPPHGWTTIAKVVKILDGDTIDVEVTRVVRVRLLDCWAPEKYTEKGPASTENLKKLLNDGEVTLHVPVRTGNMKDVFTFGRALGHVWSKTSDSKSVSELQVEQGFATVEK